MNPFRRYSFASSLALLAAVLLTSGLLAGCSDNGSEPSPAAPNTSQEPSQADLLEAMVPALALIDEGLFADATETSLAGSTPSSQEAVASPIQPLRFWRHITDV
ncbi:MAG TPA: hypothetical protein VFP58_00425, partial [Candidatus Eisenbacteria bacterium]|nr:hypothetical protein [Candidatus Eisenbacteria bacterium]